MPILLQAILHARAERLDLRMVEVIGTQDEHVDHAVVIINGYIFRADLGRSPAIADAVDVLHVVVVAEGQADAR